MIRILKKKNPNLKGEEFIDENFLRLLKDALFTLNLGTGNKYIAQAMIYKNIGEDDCEDCSDEKIKRSYKECNCEWCEDCHYNYCVCDLDSFQKLRNYTTHIAIKYLNRKQLSEFQDFILKINSKHEYSSQLKLLNEAIVKKDLKRYSK